MCKTKLSIAVFNYVLLLMQKRHFTWPCAQKTTWALRCEAADLGENTPGQKTEIPKCGKRNNSAWLSEQIKP